MQLFYYFLQFLHQSVLPSSRSTFHQFNLIKAVELSTVKEECKYDYYHTTRKIMLLLLGGVHCTALTGAVTSGQENDDVSRQRTIRHELIVCLWCTPERVFQGKQVAHMFLQNGEASGVEAQSGPALLSQFTSLRNMHLMQERRNKVKSA